MADTPYLTVITAVLGVVIVSPFVMSFFRKNQFEVNGKTILLTGASEGLGKAAAEQLAAKGANLILASRSVVKLEAAMVDIKAAASSPSTQRFHYILTDVSDPSAIAHLLTQSKAWNNDRALDIVWCIAGYSQPGLFLETSMADMRRQMNVNYWSCAEMAHGILGEWLAPPSRGSVKAKKEKDVKHLIFTSSVAVFATITGYSTYAPGKWAIRALSDSLVQEMLLYKDSCPSEVKIHTVFPGTIDSPGLKNENLTKPAITHILEASDPVQSPEVVAKKSIQGLERGEYLVTVTWLGVLMRGAMQGGSPRNSWWFDTLMSWLAAVVWLFVGPDLDGKVRRFGKDKGHPRFYGVSGDKL